MHVIDPEYGGSIFL